jgi:hypothetical protein
MIRWEPPDREPSSVAFTVGSATRPAGMCSGAGHIVVYGNSAFLAEFGESAVGLPAREGMLGLPGEAFVLLDAVLRAGKPLARWVTRDDEEWRLTAVPRRDPGTDEVHGVAFHLRARSDVPDMERE